MDETDYGLTPRNQGFGSEQENQSNQRSTRPPPRQYWFCVPPVIALKTRGPLGAVGQFERALIKERQREGIAIAKVKKPYKGRKSALNEVGVAKLKQMEAAGSSKIKIVETLGISRASVYSYLNACLISKRKLFNRPKAVVFKRLLSVTSRDNP